MNHTTGEMRIWVTATNHEWVCEMSGYSLKEIEEMYEDARARGEVCTLIVKKNL